ncbi:MAG TPA: prephenate dehydratase [Candidatus Nanopusillus sp.]|nr:prephenate dehydratase [Candidatus Nanopusillus sp.]
MRILIYGVGGMGSFFKNFFYSRGYDVAGYDIVKEKSDVEINEIGKFDVIFLCTPIGTISDALVNIKNYARDDVLLVDISSIKSNVLPLLDKSGFDYLSIHPMFGPNSDISLSNIIVVVKSGREEEKIILNEFKKAGAIITNISRDLHDHKMAEIQGLPHFILLALADFLSENFKDNLRYATPIFHIIYKLTARILNQDWKMYYLIQKNAENLREKFVQHIIEFHERVKNENEFKKLFHRLNLGRSDPFILEAYKATIDVDSLHLLRSYIKVLDYLILRLIERRANAGRKIAIHKKRINEPIAFSKIEGVKIKELVTQTDLNPLYIQQVYDAIVNLTREEEYKVVGIRKKLAVLGPKGSFSEEAALNLIGSRLPLVYCSTTDEVIKLVENSIVDYGLVPIENSINGTVLPVLDSLLSRDVEVFGETKLEINHCLVAKRELSLKDIRVIYSHPQAIAQCMKFINNYLPNVEIRYTSSTSDAIRLLDKYSAAIASETAARLNKLYILRKGIQDITKNITRFYLIRKKGKGEKKGSVTALFFGVEDRPGALKDVLEVFYKRNINLRKLESRPARTKLGEYIFFVEAERNLNDEELIELRKVTTFYKIIGIFDEIKKLDDIWDN